KRATRFCVLRGKILIILICVHVSTQSPFAAFFFVCQCIRSKPIRIIRIAAIRITSRPLDAIYNGTHFIVMVASFGTTTTPRSSNRRVEDTQKVTAPPHRGVAGETLTLLVDGVEQRVEVVRQERHLGGTQAYWCCPQCSTLRAHLYWHQGALACRACLR